MANDFVAKASTTIHATAAEVWDALVDPVKIKEYMFGTDVTSDWKVGGPITWKGEWEGRPYEDKGEILQLTPPRVLQYTHFSPMTGLPDKPENYHTVTIELAENGTATSVTLTQDNNADEKDREHSEKNWSMMLDGLKTFVEKQR
jgi:uncharacterized protein YndB with AHSA1/START domain